jgi:hypothetical protein
MQEEHHTMINTTPKDNYSPRPISRHEYEMVCESSQHFSETYEQYCDRIHAQEHAEYLRLKENPDETELLSSVVEDLDGYPQLIYFKVDCHYLGNNACTRRYHPSELDMVAIADIGEEAFSRVMEKYDGKTIVPYLE